MSQSVELQVTSPNVLLEITTGTGTRGATGPTGPQGPADTSALYDFYTTLGNVDPGETDLYSASIVANQLVGDGDKLRVTFAGTTVGHATATREIKLYFAGTMILDTATFINAAAGTWVIDGFLERASSTTVRYALSFNRSVATTSVIAVGELTGLTLSGANILKISAEAAAAGAASDDIKALLGSIVYVRAG